MLKFRPLQTAGALFLICLSVAFAAENRESGTWRVRSVRIVEGPSTTPHLAVNTVMTLKQAASGDLTLQVNPKQPGVTDQVVQIERREFSPDGKTKTETVSSLPGNTIRYRIVYVWDKQ